jgi:hypothetical protein
MVLLVLLKIQCFALLLMLLFDVESLLEILVFVFQ